MKKIDYETIYKNNKEGWSELTENPQRYEALLAGHYSDSNHFVYELLQNAEDAYAKGVVFEYYSDKLVFYHDGKPFDAKDVRGVSSMLMGTKDENDAQTIGRFGMGFKSVFKYTYQPEIYSDTESFRIENYLLPVEIKEHWNYQEEMKSLIYQLSEEQKICPFEKSKHLTKFVIPFAKREKDGKIIKIWGDDVLGKLNNIDREILLFLTHIKNLFWIDKTTNKCALISLNESKSDANLKICKIEGSDYGEKGEIVNYLKFIRKFNHEQMKSAEVSIAYKLNNPLNNINEMERTNIWVYFPTKDTTDLPFLIHGSFETAVSREKLMSPSAFNSELFQELGDLICESLLDLRNRKLITQNFIRKIIIPAFMDNTIIGLKKKITKIFIESELLPDREGNFKKPNGVSMAVPFGMADFFAAKLFQETFQGIKSFVAFNNDKELNFTEYFNWLKDDLHVHIFNLEAWAKRLSNTVNINSTEIDSDTQILKNFYKLLYENREDICSSDLTYNRRRPYELVIRNRLQEAWNLLRTAPIVLNANNKLMPAFQNGKAMMYLNSSSEYKSVIADSLVNNNIAKEFLRLLSDELRIEVFDNYQYMKEKVIKKYINIDKNMNIRFENSDNYEEEYIEDLKQIFKLIEDQNDTSKVKELLNEAYIIAIIQDNDQQVFGKPGAAYIETSNEGIDLKTYFAELENIIKVWPINMELYKKHGISDKKLSQLGVVCTPVNEGDRENINRKYGTTYWSALDGYCPKIKIVGLIENMVYIRKNPNSGRTKNKSAEILKLLLSISDKLSGKITRSKTRPEVHDEIAESYKNVVQLNWLYDKNGNLSMISNLSKFDLNQSIYGEPINEKGAYSRLGFIETEDDAREDAFVIVSALDLRSKNELLIQLAKELGMTVLDSSDCRQEIENDEGIFNLNDWSSNEFPIKYLRNKERLIEHIKQQFFCADPITYKQVWRRIRDSKDSIIVRAYAIGMYTNDSDVKICQICKQPIEQVEVVEIANYGIELEQLNLCLCRNCAGKYKSLRDKKKDEFKKSMKSAIQELDADNDGQEYVIELGPDLQLDFTQIHVAEIQAIFSLIDEFGLPNLNNQKLDMSDDEMLEDLYNMAYLQDEVSDLALPVT
ncbi:sacsin N-terminal ATP-binding-like domain-containing protein [Acetobacterium sp.]|uniref:sacsin N-terminal ATP-binding-like domain-containing protein n=1 Tax=Acetobacterium sp. TaxID=1872094 RepID=UPI002F3E81D1